MENSSPGHHLARKGSARHWSREQSSTQAGRAKSAGHCALVYLSEMYTRSSSSTGPSLFHMIKQPKTSTDEYCPLRQFKQEHFRTPLQHISSSSPSRCCSGNPA
jgi:hypothetical protein